MPIRPVIPAALVALALAGAAPDVRAGEGRRIAIGGVRNDPGEVLDALTGSLCARFACVPRARVVQRGRLDFAAARREGVDAVLFGTVEGPRPRRVLALAVLRGSLRPERTWRLPLDGRGRLDPSSLADVGRDLSSLLGPSAPAPGRRPATAATSSPRPPRPPADAAPTPEPAPRRGEPPRVPPAVASSIPPEPRRGDGRAPDAPAQVPARTAEPATADRQGFAALELGAAVLQRRLEFQGVGSSPGTLRAFSGGTLVAPAVRAEVFPWAASVGQWQAGLGAFGGYARSVGFQTENASTGLTHDTVYSALDAGLAYRIAPLGSLRLALVPALWYRTLSFTVSPASGTALAGLPDLDLSGFAAGLGVELPLGTRWTILADGSYTVWTTAKDLVGGSYFPSGSASAFDVDAGASLQLWGRFSLRALATFDLTRFSLRGSTTYAATGATDRYLGARAMLRARF